jgi:hypothetical protein
MFRDQFLKVVNQILLSSFLKLDVFEDQFPKTSDILCN